MGSVRRPLGALVAVLLMAGLAAVLLPPVAWPDRPIPAPLAESVPTARHLLWSKALDRLPPAHFTFLEARCADDGSVALVFEDHRAPWLVTTHAYVARGSCPARDDASWSGGYGIPGPVLADEEFVRLMGADPPRCAG